MIEYLLGIQLRDIQIALSVNLKYLRDDRKDIFFVAQYVSSDQSPPIKSW